MLGELKISNVFSLQNLQEICGRVIDEAYCPTLQKICDRVVDEEYDHETIQAREIISWLQSLSASERETVCNKVMQDLHK